MRMICRFTKVTGLITGLLLLGSAMAPLADAWAVVCQNRNGRVSCWIQE